jgi:hypothetical protein
MRKLPSILDNRYSILLILLIGLLFSNTIFAGENFEKRCKVEYTQLDLITGTETIYEEISSTFNVYNQCKEGLKRLSKKMYKWIDESNVNIITNISEFKCKIKNIETSIIFFSYNWNRYRDCDGHIQKLSENLVNDYPNKIGAKVYKNSITD